MSALRPKALQVSDLKARETRLYATIHTVPV
jgi:hypothetical protein